jgi:hypothetical protein
VTLLPILLLIVALTELADLVLFVEETVRHSDDRKATSSWS